MVTIEQTSGSRVVKSLSFFIKLYRLIFRKPEGVKIKIPTLQINKFIKTRTHCLTQILNVKLSRNYDPDSIAMVIQQRKKKYKFKDHEIVSAFIKEKHCVREKFNSEDIIGELIVLNPVLAKLKLDQSWCLIYGYERREVTHDSFVVKFFIFHPGWKLNHLSGADLKKEIMKIEYWK